MADNIRTTRSVSRSQAEIDAKIKFQELINNGVYELSDSGDPDQDIPRTYIYHQPEEGRETTTNGKIKKRDRKPSAEKINIKKRKTLGLFLKIGSSLVGIGTLAELYHEVSLKSQRNIANSPDVHSNHSPEVAKKVNLVPLQTTETHLITDGNYEYYEVLGTLRKGDTLVFAGYNATHKNDEIENDGGIFVDAMARETFDRRNSYMNSPYHPDAVGGKIPSTIVIWPSNAIAWPESVESGVVEFLLRIKHMGSQVKGRYGMFTTKEQDAQNIVKAVKEKYRKELGDDTNIADPVILSHLGFTNGETDTVLSPDSRTK